MTGIRLADRMARLGTESAFEVLARARAIEDAGGKMIHLEIGEPDFPTAQLRWLTLPAARDTTSEPNLRVALARIEPLLKPRAT